MVYQRSSTNSGSSSLESTSSWRDARRKRCRRSLSAYTQLVEHAICNPMFLRECNSAWTNLGKRRRFESILTSCPASMMKLQTSSLPMIRPKPLIPRNLTAKTQLSMEMVHYYTTIRTVLVTLGSEAWMLIHGVHTSRKMPAKNRSRSIPISNVIPKAPSNSCTNSNYEV